MKLYVMSCCFNEEEILPFYLDYYTNFIKADKIIIYDGGSTDNTPNIVKNYPNVEFIVDSKEKMDERNLRDIRNNGWKKYRDEYDWVIVCDMDEFIYHPNLKELLLIYDSENITIAKVNGYDMVSKDFPTFEKGKFLPSFITKGVHEPIWLNKSAVFNPKKVDINYDYGTHSCLPTGDIKYSETSDIKLLQYKWLSHEYITDKSLKASQRLSDWNLETGMASHYKEYAKMNQDTFMDKLNTSTEIITDFPKKKDIYLFSHNYLINNWKEILENQLKLIKSSGLYDQMTNMYLMAFGESQWKDLMKIIRSYDIDDKIITLSIDENFYEYPTLQKLYKFVKNIENSHILYFHLKGVWSSLDTTRNNEAIVSWRKCLEYFNIEKWKDCVEKLDEGNEVVGALYNYNEKEPLFSGNFWWTTSDYIKKLKYPEYDSSKNPYLGTPEDDGTWCRVECEKWINTIPNKFHNFYIPKDYGFYYVPIDEKDYRETKISHIYQNIDGWFDFEDVYSDMVKIFPNESHFVEIGSWLGKSTSYMAVEIANSGKKINFDVIDTWEGTQNPDEKKFCDDMFNMQNKENTDTIYDVFLKNVLPVKNYINHIRGWSYDIVKKYSDNSIDFIYIDGSHNYESVKKDILDWYPKIKNNGIIAGHDYIDGWPGVIKAVNEVFGTENVKVIGHQSWLIEKEKIENQKNKKISELLEKPRMYFNNNPDGNINTLHGLKDLINENINQNSVICEIGSFAGISSELFSLFCKEIHCVDSWTPIEEIWWMRDYIIESEKLFDEMSKRNSNVTKVKKTSEEASKDYPDEYFDLVYIDGAHDYINVKKDILNWLPKIKKNGIISGHDYYAFESNIDTDVKIILDELFKGVDIKIYSDSSWSIRINDIHKKIALVCISKNEDYLEEWLKYNHKLGFDHIYVYENNWKCDIDLPYVTKIPWDGDVQQLPAYNNFIEIHKKNYDYVAFFDCDEFLVLKKHRNIHDFIQEYGNKNIAINWQYYGSGGKIKKGNSLLKQFTKRQIGVNEHIKSIIYLKIDSVMELPHNPNTPTFDTNGKMIIGAFNPDGPEDVVVLNHYQDKTKEDYESKIKRGYSDTLNRPILIEDWEKRKELNIEIEDFTAFNFLYNSEYKISVIIPTYNRDLDKCVESVLNQKYDNMEILICHDGEWKDKKDYKDNRIKYLHTYEWKNDLGASQRNFCLDLITGDYVLFLDDDNILYDNYLNKMVSQINENTGMLVCKIHFNDKRWTNLILPRQEKMIPCEIDHLSILFKSDVAKRFKWDSDWGQDHRYINNCENFVYKNGLQIKYINDILANHQYLGQKNERPVIVFNHNYLIGNWEIIIKEQLSLLKDSGLYEKLTNVYSYVSYELYPTIEKFKEIIHEFDYLNKFEIIINDKNNFEFDCLIGMSKFCEGVPADICYFHTKGVYSEQISENIGVKTWRDYLNYFTLTKWRDSIKQLKTYDIVGVNYDHNDLHNDYVIGGNFFWTKSEYIKSLPLPKLSENRFEAESWIMKNQQRSVYQLFNTGDFGFKNLYMEILNPMIYKTSKIENIVDYSFEKYKTQQNKWEYNEFLRKLVEKGKTKNILEIGSKYGGTTYGFCNIFDSVVSIDIFKEPEIIELEKEFDNLTFILGDSHNSDTKSKLKDIKFDVVYIDGDHHYEAVKQDYLDYREFVKDDGIIMFHDIKQTWWTDSIEIQVPILWNEIKNDYDYEEIINNENDCFGIGFLYKKTPKEQKEVIIMTAHPNFKTSEDITKSAIQSFGDRDIILSTHCPVSVELQKMVKYFLYDKNNPLIRHDYYDQSWFNTDEYYALIKLHKNDNDLQHALAVYINYYNAVMYAKSLGYTTTICTNFDIVFSTEDLNTIDSKIKEMYQLGKKSFFLTSNANEGIHYKTIFFITDVNFFLDNFKYVTNEIEYNKLTREVGSETNCLENFFYQTLKNSDKLLLQQISENDLFSSSQVNMFSNIEYFTILPLRNDNNHFVIWFSSANSIDNRHIGINVLKNSETIFSHTEDLTQNYSFYKEIEFEKGCNYEIICNVHYTDVVNQKIIVVNDEIFSKIKEYGDFWKK